MNNGEKEKKRPEGESNDGLLASLGSVSIASVASRAAAANAAATNVVPEVPPNTEAQTKRQKLDVLVNDVLGSGGETAILNISRLETDLPQRIQDDYMDRVAGGFLWAKAKRDLVWILKIFTVGICKTRLD